MSEMRVEVSGLGEFRSECRLTIVLEPFFESSQMLLWRRSGIHLCSSVVWSELRGP